MEPWQVSHHEKLADYGARITSLEKRMKGAEGMQETLNSLAKSVAVFAEQLAVVREDTSEIKTELGKIKDVPGQRWSSLVTVIITAIASGLVGAVLRGLIGG